MQPESTCIRRPNSYWSHCRCDDCIRDRARKSKLAYVYGYNRVPADTAWERLSVMIDARWTPRAIGSATGLGPEFFRHYVTQYHRGERVYMGPVVAQKIMQAGRPTEGQVGAEPTRRRLRALACIGWGLNDLVVETGVKFSTLAMVRNSNERVSATVANAVADTYDRLSGRPGQSQQAIREAREKGWAPPLAYDDIDDPDEQPTGFRICAHPDCAKEVKWRGLCLPHYNTSREWANNREQRRRAAEEARYDDEEARRASNAYRAGDQSKWAIDGHRVHRRRTDRARAEAKRAAS